MHNIIQITAVYLTVTSFTAIATYYCIVVVDFVIVVNVVRDNILSEYRVYHPSAVVVVVHHSQSYRWQRARFPFGAISPNTTTTFPFL
jgi:hypothetical protein